MSAKPAWRAKMEECARKRGHARMTFRVPREFAHLCAVLAAANGCTVGEWLCQRLEPVAKAEMDELFGAEGKS